MPSAWRWTRSWASIDELVCQGNAAGTQFDREDLLHVVATSDTKRFSASADRLRICATQCHSATVELGLSPQESPSVLSHGTATRFVDSILSVGCRVPGCPHSQGQGQGQPSFADHLLRLMQQRRRWTGVDSAIRWR